MGPHVWSSQSTRHLHGAPLTSGPHKQLCLMRNSSKHTKTWVAAELGLPGHNQGSSSGSGSCMPLGHLGTLTGGDPHCSRPVDKPGVSPRQRPAGHALEMVAVSGPRHTLLSHPSRVQLASARWKHRLPPMRKPNPWRLVRPVDTPPQSSQPGLCPGRSWCPLTRPAAPAARGRALGMGCAEGWGCLDLGWGSWSRRTWLASSRRGCRARGPAWQVGCVGDHAGLGKGGNGQTEGPACF